MKNILKIILCVLVCYVTIGLGWITKDVIIHENVKDWIAVLGYHGVVSDKEKKEKAERTGKRETLQPDRGSVCDLWPDLLVRHQSGYQQLRKFCHEECISHSAAVHHDLPRRCGCDRCSSQKCHRSRPGCRCSNHGRLLSPDHTVCHHQKYRCTPFCGPADF